MGGITGSLLNPAKTTPALASQSTSHGSDTAANGAAFELVTARLMHAVSSATLLLDVYVTVLTALQHGMVGLPPPPSPLVVPDLRLVTVMQLCAYLIERQCQAVDLCL